MFFAIQIQDFIVYKYIRAFKQNREIAFSVLNIVKLKYLREEYII